MNDHETSVQIELTRTNVLGIFRAGVIAYACSRSNSIYTIKLLVLIAASLTNTGYLRTEDELKRVSAWHY